MSKPLNKAFSLISDVAVVVGSAVGVGLISGKETQVFVATVPNAAIFAAVFCLILTFFREFCRKNAVFNTSALAGRCFPRFAFAFNAALAFCSFVCLVTCIAGAQQCLDSLLHLTDLPLYAVAVSALGAVLMTRGMSVLKVCNVCSIVMTAALFVFLAARPRAYSTASPPVYMPPVYALFTFTMSLGLTCRLGANATRSLNVASSVLSAVVLACALIFSSFVSDFSQPLPSLSGITDPYLTAFAVLTVTLSTTCSLVGCALPVCELVDGVVGDKTATLMCVFCLACAFSLFGFDFLVKYGYVFVAVIGIVTLIITIRSSLPVNA